MMTGGRGSGAHRIGALDRARGGEQHVLVPDAEDAALFLALPPLQQAPRASARVTRLFLHGTHCLKEHGDHGGACAETAGAMMAIEPIGPRGFARVGASSKGAGFFSADAEYMRLTAATPSLQNDIILVRRRVTPTIMTLPSHNDEAYFATMKQLYLVRRQMASVSYSCASSLIICLA